MQVVMYLGSNPALATTKGPSPGPMSQRRTKIHDARRNHRRRLSRELACSLSFSERDARGSRLDQGRGERWHLPRGLAGSPADYPARILVLGSNQGRTPVMLRRSRLTRYLRLAGFSRPER